jgi:hypothetical protein
MGINFEEDTLGNYVGLRSLYRQKVKKNEYLDYINQR